MTWRPLPDESSSLTSVGQGLAEVAARLHTPAVLDYRRTAEIWQDVAGSRLAEHAEVAGVKHRRLLVMVDDDRWSTQLRWLQGDLVNTINSRMGSEVLEGLEIKRTPSRRRDEG